MPECSIHPGVETNVRCAECDRYICSKDMVQTPVGYKCRECARPTASELGYVKPKQYLYAVLAGVGAGLVGGIVLGAIGFRSIILALVFGVAVAEATRRGSGGHRTPAIAAIAAVSAVIGAFAGGMGVLSAVAAGAVAAVVVAANRW